MASVSRRNLCKIERTFVLLDIAWPRLPSPVLRPLVQRPRPGLWLADPPPARRGLLVICTGKAGADKSISAAALDKSVKAEALAQDLTSPRLRPAGSSSRTLAKGQQTKATIVEAALGLATHIGLEGLSIGAIAELTGMSKSGVFAHFGSREELQISVVHEYHDRFEQEVFYPRLKRLAAFPVCVRCSTTG